ncbi:MAG: hypothetical protein R3E31_28170 [Chloroflexota bacterium]|nr:hypothetical protein [Anaerolineales bacterium]MCB8966526.1 hypothetical protein [Ardenticatenaceae bacterium]MCB8989214.1 hypothetical protein [Ardenticatenaceae bacterium]
MSKEPEYDDETLAETDNFTVWRSQEEDDFVYHIELGGVSLHLSSEEWEELVVLFKSVA